MPADSTAHRHRRILVTLCAACALSLNAARGYADDEEAEGPELDNIPGVEWVKGPATGPMRNTASIDVPEGYRFTGADGATTMMQLMENLPTGSEMGLIGPPDLEWFIIFEFNDIGYVKDDEKDSIDANAILSTIKEGQIESNKMRAANGLPPMTIRGWVHPPHYDEATQSLEWAIRAESEGHEIVNFNTRRLGRKGVMRVTLVADPEGLDATIIEAKKLLTGFSFNDGQTYADFESGDKIAEYGLTALMTGGLAAVAWKSGLLKHIGKIIVAAVIGIGALFKKIFGGGNATEVR